MHSHSQKPKGPIVKVVRDLASSSYSTCQYTYFRSSVENHTAPCRQSKVSSILGDEYPSFTVLLSLCRSIQNLSPPIFFSNKHHSTGPGAEASSNCTQLNHLLEVLGGFLLYLCLNGLGSVILMARLTMLLLPRSKSD